jgi:hypothetical protein
MVVLQGKRREGMSSRLRKDGGVPFLPTKRKGVKALATGVCVSTEFSRGSISECSSCELTLI